MSEVDQSLNFSSSGSVFSSGSAAGSILVIDDEGGIRESLEVLLSLEGYSVKTAPDGEQGLRMLEMESFDLVLLDLALPGQSGLDLLPQIKERQPETPVIMITAYGTVENVVEAIRAGAENFVQKPWDNEKLLADIRSAVARYKAEEENLQLKRTLKQRYNFANIVGKSEIMLRVFDLVSQVAPSRSTVLIQGESGTGKELIAKAIHANSPRRDKPFVPINTGAMPTELLESTLFGHVKGAFTSAIASKKGLFEVANGGTLSSSTKSLPWARTRRQRFCASCRIAASCISAEFRRSRSTSASSQPPISICARPSAKASSARTFSIAST
jgi:DNA-binding NtrC family response regulator